MSGESEDELTKGRGFTESAYNAKMLGTRSPTGRSEVADRAKKKEISVERRSTEDINTRVVEQPDPGPERSKQTKTEVTRK